MVTHPLDHATTVEMLKGELSREHYGVSDRLDGITSMCTLVNREHLAELNREELRRFSGYARERSAWCREDGYCSEAYDRVVQWCFALL